MFMMKNSCPDSQSELDIFTNAPTSADVESGYHVQYQPTSNISEGPIRFHIHNDQQDYIDLLHSYLLFTLRVENHDGSVLADDAEVADVNNIVQTRFSQVDVYLNETLVTHSSNTAHYRAYLENLLSYGSDAKSSQLALNGWYSDTIEHIDTIGDQNAGYTSRKELVSKSRPFQVLTRLHTDISLQGKYLLNGVDLEIRLSRNSNALCLMAAHGSEFRVKILEASFYARKIKLGSATQLKHIKKMDSNGLSALYPIRHNEVKSFTIPTGSLSCNEEGLYSGQLPRRLIIGLVESSAYEGRYNKNPYNFQPFNLTYACVYKNGVQIPSKPFTPDFTNGCYAREYLTLFQGTGIHFTDQGLGVAYKDYKSGNTLLVFDFSGDLSDCDAYKLISKGSIRLELKFSEPLTQSLNVVVMGEWDFCLIISRDRSVSLDFLK